MLSVVPGKRCAENTNKVVSEAKKRTGGRYMDMITSDEYPGYKPAILNNYGVPEIVCNKEDEPNDKKKVGRPKKPKLVAPKHLNYSVVHKTRRKGKVVKTEIKTIFGNKDKVALSGNSKSVNTAFVERYNGTDRNANARKVRKTYMFSKNWVIHQYVTYFICYCYNFCWSVRTLNSKKSADSAEKVTPAMSAKLTDHVWSLREWLSISVVHL